MKVADAITAIVEFALPRFSPEDKLLHIPIDARASIFYEGSDEEDSTYRDIHFLFQRPGNYTKVFIAIEGWKHVWDETRRRYQWEWQEGDNRIYGIDGLNALHWHMTSDHDSCWRSDGVDSPLFQIAMQMRDAVTGCDPSLVKRVNWNVWMNPLSQSIGYVNADVVVDDEASKIRRDTHMKKPVSIGEIGA